MWHWFLQNQAPTELSPHTKQILTVSGLPSSKTLMALLTSPLQSCSAIIDSSWSLPVMSISWKRKSSMMRHWGDPWLTLLASHFKTCGLMQNVFRKPSEHRARCTTKYHSGYLSSLNIRLRFWCRVLIQIITHYNWMCLRNETLIKRSWWPVYRTFWHWMPF